MRGGAAVRRLTALLLMSCCGDAGAPPRCAVTGACTLAEAGRAAGIAIGVAAAPGDPDVEALVTREFGALSLEGELLWKIVHPSRERWDFEAADRTLAWAAEHHLATTATHFVWDQAVGIAGTPEWVKEITDPDELRAVMREHLRTLSTRYGGRITRWNVVNEPHRYFDDTLYPNHFHRVLGPDYIAEAFEIAAEEAPRSERWLNEILTEYEPRKADALVRLAADLVSRGVPIDGVSLQGHLFVGDAEWELVTDTLKRLSDLGLQTGFSEVDVPVLPFSANRLEIQANRTVRLIDACLAAPRCDSITWWGVNDGASWLNWFLAPGLAPLLFDDALAPKPAYHAAKQRLLVGR
ncbi:MAG: endo-1,4-beta-xylanase [Deltaproteobacteria bacterium]|nr:endo-1,4-beta-xylanase [Deltaproteobacteria bacterium]